MRQSSVPARSARTAGGTRESAATDGGSGNLATPVFSDATLELAGELGDGGDRVTRDQPLARADGEFLVSGPLDHEVRVRRDEPSKEGDRMNGRIQRRRHLVDAR